MLSSSLKGKRKVREESEGNLKMKEKKNKEKEVVTGDQEAKINKDPKSGGEENAKGSPKRGFTGRIFGIIMDPRKGKQKVTYPCDFCERIFHSPQALGGHQNSHKWERNLRQEIQAINITKGRRAYVSSLLTSTLPGYEPLSENHGTMTNNALNPYYKTGSSYQCKGVDTMFQHHQGNSVNGTLHGGRAFSYSQTANAGFGTGSSTLHIGKNGGFQHPERVRFNPGFGTNEIAGNSPNTKIFYEPPSSVGFNGGYGTTYGTLHGAFQPQELTRFNPGFETNDYGRVDNISGMLQQANEVEETHQNGKSGIDHFVLSPPPTTTTRNYQITERSEQVTTTAEIDFGLVPKRGGKDKENQKGETSSVDLALKL
ncbi:hypothetical protein VNO77_16939 [Canavalia gladiata]|uniref:C2H2-type domain-containing protein n=1 Tax=Canavalia gladiata TaxID=3824 RepID=A0AAN9LLM4_CANGL